MPLAGGGDVEQARTFLFALAAHYAHNFAAVIENDKGGIRLNLVAHLGEVIGIFVIFLNGALNVVVNGGINAVAAAVKLF